MHFRYRNVLYIGLNIEKLIAREMNFGNIYTTINDVDTKASI